MRRTWQVFAAGLLVALAGCTNTRTDGPATVVTFEWWVPALIIVAGLVAIPVGLFVRRKSFYGWILLIGGPVAAAVFGPGFALDRVIVTPDVLTMRTGMWFDPTVREVRFADLSSVVITKTETRGRRGRKNISYDLKCTKKSGGQEVIPLGTLMEDGGAEAFAKAATASGVMIVDGTGGG